MWRRRLTLGGCFGLVALALVLVFWQTEVAPVSHFSTHASPREMTVAYLRAAQGGDCVSTWALTTPHTGAWCGGPLAHALGEPDLKAYRAVGQAEFVPKSAGGAAEECVPSLITQTNMNGAAPGSMQWSWCWTKTAHGWRLYDQGQG